MAALLGVALSGAAGERRPSQAVGLGERRHRRQPCRQRAVASSTHAEPNPVPTPVTTSECSSA